LLVKNFHLRDVVAVNVLVDCGTIHLMGQIPHDHGDVTVGIAEVSVDGVSGRELRIWGGYLMVVGVD